VAGAEGTQAVLCWASVWRLEVGDAGVRLRGVADG
jgi:hypothetical protein